MKDEEKTSDRRGDDGVAIPSDIFFFFFGDGSFLFDFRKSLRGRRVEGKKTQISGDEKTIQFTKKKHFFFFRLRIFVFISKFTSSSKQNLFEEEKSVDKTENEFLKKYHCFICVVVGKNSTKITSQRRLPKVHFHHSDD